MDSAVTVFVGLGAALLGVIGGHFGTLRLENQRIARRRVGMVKALLGELRHNGGLCVDIRHLGPTRFVPTYSTDTWDAARFEIGQFVPDELFEDLLFVYEDVLPRVQRLLHDWTGAWPDPDIDRVVAEFAESIKRSMKGLLSLPQAGAFRHRWQVRLEAE